MASRDKVADAEDCKAHGNEALSAKQYDKAIEWYTQALKLHQNHVYYSNRSAAYLSKNFADSALKDAESCIKLKPDWPKGYSRKGAALHKLRQYDKAIAAYKEGLKLEPENEGLISGLKAVEEEKANPFGTSYANGSEEDNDMSGMSDMTRNMLKTIQNSPKLMGYMKDPVFVKMMEDVQKNPQNIGMYMQDPRLMEVVTEMIGMNPDLMEKAKERSKEEDQKDKERREQMEKDRLKREKEELIKKEQEEFEQMPEEEKQKVLNKRKAEQLKEEGNELYKHKKFDEAIKKYDEAIELDPTNMNYLTNKSAVLLEQGNLEGCVELCQKAITIGRESYADYSLIAKAYARIGNAYFKHGQYKEAIDNYTKSQLENKTNDVERKIKQAEKKLKELEEKAYLDPEKAKEAKEAGNDKFKAGDFPGAVKDYSEAIKRDPENAVYYNNRAAAYMKLADFGRAMDDCKAAIKRDPKYVKAFSRKGNIELFLKEYHKAMDTFNAGLEIEKDNKECQDGLQRTMYLIQQQNAGMGNESDEDRQKRAARAMEDPEIRNIMSDPVMRSVLQEMQTDPKAAGKHMQNPEVAGKISKLVAAGIIGTR